jgi:hypothetical protein
VLLGDTRLSRAKRAIERMAVPRWRHQRGARNGSGGFHEVTSGWRRHRRMGNW